MRKQTEDALAAIGRARATGDGRNPHDIATEAVGPQAMSGVIGDLVDQGFAPSKCIPRQGEGKEVYRYLMELTSSGKAAAKRLAE